MSQSTISVQRWFLQLDMDGSCDTTLKPAIFSGQDMYWNCWALSWGGGPSVLGHSYVKRLFIFPDA